jgi:hypothetical protein
MEVLLALVGGVTLYSLCNKKEKFEETYYDSASYYKQHVSPTENKQTNQFTPNELDNRHLNLVRGDNNKFADYNNNTGGYPIADQYLREPQTEFIKKNSLYNNDKINGISLKDYYDKYTNDVLNNGTWFLNKDMPEETKQYQDDSQIQQKMEMFTGLLQKRDREDLGVPNRQETLNLFTPEERITGYGYQYGQSGFGPGLTLTRSKEMEDLKQSIKFKTNEQPFEKIQVGRGLAVGTEIPAAGGFQQFTRVLPSNASDYSANQLPGRVAGGKWVYSNAPTSQQPVLKNRPNSYYSLCQRGPATGKSTMTAQTIRPDVAVLLKNQNRTTINYGFGVPLTNLESFLEK